MYISFLEMATTAAAADTPIVESSTSPETTIPLAVAEREVTAVLNEVVDVVEASEALVEDVVAGAGVADAAGRGAQYRGDAEACSRRTPGSLLRVGRPEVEDDRAHRGAHRAARNDQRGLARPGPRHG